MQLQLFVCSLEHRFIWLQLYGKRTIDQGIAEQFVRMLNRLNIVGSGPVTVYLAGPGGGDYYACLKMAQAIFASSNPVIVVPFHRVHSGCFMLTQTGTACYALANTVFTFHRATDYFIGDQIKNGKMSQQDYQERLSQLQLIDGSRLFFFTRRGRPIKRIFELFTREARLTVRDAKRLKLIEGTYDQGSFTKDRRVANRLERPR